MSDTLDAPEGVRLGAYCGPENGEADRQRWQIETNGIVTLNRDDALLIIRALTQSLGERPPSSS